MLDWRERVSPTTVVLGLIVISALGIRLAYLWQYQQLPDWGMLTVDNWYHHHWAQSLAEGNIFGDTTYFRAPFYTYCLGFLYAALGDSLWVGRLFGVALGLSSVIVTYFLGLRLFNRSVGLMAAALHALYPIMIYMESELLLDPLFTLLVELFLLRLLIWFDSGSHRDLWWAALICGLAAITRPTILVALPLVLGTIWLRGRTTANPIRPRWRQTFIFLGGLAILIAPVTVRNLVVAGDPVLVSSQAGINLWVGNNSSADGVSASLPEPLGHNWQISQVTYTAETALGKKLKPGEVSTYWTGVAADWILAHPLEFGRLFLTKLGHQFSNREISNNRELEPIFQAIPVLRYNWLSFGLIFPLAMLGAVSSWQKGPKARFSIMLVGSYILVISLFFFNSRFRLPLIPIYLVFASAGIGHLSTMPRQKRWHAVKAAGIIAVGGLFSWFPPVSLPTECSPTAELSSGLHYFHRNQHRLALAQFAEAFECNPAFPEVSLNLGACYFRLGIEDTARFWFQRELSLYPDRAKSYHNIASLELVSGNFRAGGHLAGRALKLAPYDALANRLRLRALAADSLITNDSLFSAAKAAAQATDDPLPILNEAAGLLAERSAFKPAQTLLSRALAASPPPIETDDQAFGPLFVHSQDGMRKQKAKTYAQLGYLAGIDGRSESAIDFSRLAIAGDSTLVEAYVNLITGLFGLGRTADADQVLLTADRRFGNHPRLQQLKSALGLPY